MNYSTLSQVNRRLGDLEEMIRLVMAGGGGGNADVSFSQWKWIDGGTSATGHNGSVAQPYSTVSQFLAGIPVSGTAVLSQAMMVGAVLPSPTNGYVENLTIPAYRNVELRANQLSVNGLIGGITGNVTWANTASAAGATHAPTTLASFVLHNIPVSGTITITDDGTVASELFLSGDELGLNAMAGAVTANTTTAFAALTMTCAGIGGAVNLGSSASSGLLTMQNGSQVVGAVTAKQVVALNSQFNSSITTAAASNSAFTSCAFPNGTAFTGGAGSTVTFDGPSWRNFVENGGTVTTAITLVIGGYSGGAVAGANLTNANVSVGINGTGATAGFTGGGNWYTLPAATLSGAHTVTLLTGAGEKAGDTILISRVDASANTYTVVNGGGGGGNIAVLPASLKGSCLASFNGTNWVLAQGGSDFT